MSSRFYIGQLVRIHDSPSMRYDNITFRVLSVRGDTYQSSSYGWWSEQYLEAVCPLEDVLLSSKEVLKGIPKSPDKD